MTELRALVEIPTIRRLAEQGIAAADLARLRPMAAEIEDAARRRDFVAHVATDLEFHLALLDLAGNPRITELVRSLRMHSRLYGLRDETHRDALFASWHEHAELLDRIEARDAAGAEAVMRSHIGHVRGIWAEPTPRALRPAAPAAVPVTRSKGTAADDPRIDLEHVSARARPDGPDTPGA